MPRPPPSDSPTPLGPARRRQRRWGILLGGAILALLAAAALPAQETRPKETGLTGVLSEKEFKALHELKAGEAPEPKGSMIDLGDGRAYLSLPKGRKAPVPGVVVIHEWWGLNRHIKHWADRLAADGYAALAVDLYGGEVATTRDGAMELMRSVDEKAAHATIERALAFLEEDGRVKAKRRAAIGWCFGGGWSLKAALAHPGLDVAVVYYGRLVTDPERLKKIKARLLCIFGNQDRGIPPRVVDEFAKALKEAGVDQTILRYDANHAFANPSSARYDQQAASSAWKNVRAFLGRTLGEGR